MLRNVGGTHPYLDRTVESRFRRADPDDAEAIHRLSAPFMVSGNLLVREPWVFQLLIEDFWVLDVDGQLVAGAGLRRFSGVAEILNMVVHEHWQGRGLGRILLNHMVAVAQAEGFEQVLVFSRTAVPWFTRNGFQPISPDQVPAERVALTDPARGSIPLRRSTTDHAEAAVVHSGVQSGTTGL